MGILLVGSHGTGKSTLAKEIQKMFSSKMAIIDNIHREAKKDGFQINKTDDVDSQIETVRRYLTKVRELQGRPFVSVDGILRQTAYAIYNKLPKSVITLMKELCILERDYFVSSTNASIIIDDCIFPEKMVLYLPIEFPLEEDGVRSGDDAKFQKGVDCEIRKLLMSFYMKNRHDRFYIITGPIEQRVEKVQKLLVNKWWRYL